jgi:hypothetical protein
MTEERLAALQARGWRLTRDGSTATAFFAWDDPEDTGDGENGWQVMVLHTAGHGSRFNLDAEGSALTERPAADLRRLREALGEALELLEGWQGELPEDG